MPPNNKIKVIKIPLSQSKKMIDIPQTFPPMPRLYLELLENKAKIKQTLVNKEYVPKTNPDTQTNGKYEKTEEIKEYKGGGEDKKSLDSIKISDSSRSEGINKGSISISDSGSNSGSNSGSDRSGSDRSDSDSGSDDSDRSDSGSKSYDRSDSDEDDDRKSVNASDDEDEKNDTDSENLPDILHSLLADDNNKPSIKEKFSVRESPEIEDRSHKQHKNRSVDISKYSRQRESILPNGGGNAAVPPSLAELGQKGGFQMRSELRDVTYTAKDEQEEIEKKRELLFKFDMLRKSYPGAKTRIPDFSVHSDLMQMQKEYDYTVRRLSLDSTVEGYKSYLIMGFMAVEYIFGSILKFDMQGFTQQQIVSMHTYEKLLIELGEKSYVPKGSKWPVELRLLFTVLMQTAMFIVGKLIMKKTGVNLTGMLNNINRPVSNDVPPIRRRPMKGPSINLDDIPDTQT